MHTFDKGDNQPILDFLIPSLCRSSTPCFPTIVNRCLKMAFLSIPGLHLQMAYGALWSGFPETPTGLVQQCELRDIGSWGLVTEGVATAKGDECEKNNQQRDWQSILFWYSSTQTIPAMSSIDFTLHVFLKN